jgi:HAD superfamily phosphoserine phosphatase-like hydrolase
MNSVVADFDGTLLKYDLPEHALRRFGRKGWERYDKLLAAGKIAVEQCVSKQYAMIQVNSRQEVLRYIERFRQFRPGIEKLISECGRTGVQLVVVSAGLDFCIRYAFRASGLSLPRLVCPKSSLDAGKGFLLSFPRRRVAASKDFKEDLLITLKRQGGKVVFVGDGAGDFNAAIRADVLFTIAGSPLDSMCAEERIPHKSVKTLAPVWKFVRALGRGPPVLA